MTHIIDIQSHGIRWQQLEERALLGQMQVPPRFASPKSVRSAAAAGDGGRALDFRPISETNPNTKHPIVTITHGEAQFNYRN